MLANTAQPSNSNRSLGRKSAMAFFAMPLCYVVMFIIFGVVLDFPQSNVLSDRIAYMVTQEFNLALANIIGYLVFGCLLLVAVQTTHETLKTESHQLLKYASAFGFIWVILMMCSGMISLVGLDTMIRFYVEGSPHTETLFLMYTTLVNSLGVGIELVGAFWVFFLSLHGVKSSQLSKAVNGLGLVVGLIGVLTVYQAIPEFKDAFGLLQIVWFVWMGFALLKHAKRAEI